MLTEISATKTNVQQKAKDISISGSQILDVNRGITPIIPVDEGSYPNTAQAFIGDFDRYTFTGETIRVKY